MAAQVRRGELVVPGEDVIVDRFETAERVLGRRRPRLVRDVLNWAAGEAARCRHNLGYWGGGDWWGAGPGAHSHVGGVRWWNVLHPRAWTRTARRRRLARRRRARSPATTRSAWSA